MVTQNSQRKTTPNMGKQYICPNCTFWSFNKTKFYEGLCLNCYRTFWMRGQDERKRFTRMGLIKPIELQDNLSPEPKSPVTVTRETIVEAKEKYLRAKYLSKDYSPLPECMEKEGE